MPVQNQKKIYIERTSDKANKDFLKVSNENLLTAMYNLKPSTFLLWVYFTDNKDGYAMDLYPVDFCSKTRLSDSTYRRAFQELEEKGYLLKHKDKKNLYMFREVSDSKKIEKPDVVNTLDKEDFQKLKDGFISEPCQND